MGPRYPARCKKRKLREWQKGGKESRKASEQKIGDIPLNPVGNSKSIKLN